MYTKANIPFRLDLASWVHDDIDETVKQAAFLKGYDLDADISIHQIEQDIIQLASSRLLLPLQPGIALSPTIRTKGSSSLPRPATGGSTRQLIIGDLTMAEFAEAKLAIDLRLAGTRIDTEGWHASQPSQSTYRGVSIETDHEARENQNLDLGCLRRRPYNEDKKEGFGQTQDETAAMRSLLAQWQPGIDPSTYAWPGLTSHSTGTRIQLEEEEEALPTPRNPPERPPALEPRTQPQSLSQRRQLVAYGTGQSQGMEELASTQILPGPFANRQPISFRKAPNKSRTIGF